MAWMTTSRSSTSAWAISSSNEQAAGARQTYAELITLDFY
jgi:hypothetical protein